MPQKNNRSHKRIKNLIWIITTTEPPEEKTNFIADKTPACTEKITDIPSTRTNPPFTNNITSPIIISPSHNYTLPNNLTNQGLLTTSIKLDHILKAIPDFDPTKNSITEFSNTVKTFEEFISIKDQKAFITLLKFKVTGEAHKHIVNRQFSSTEHLITELKQGFSPKENLPQLQAELARITQNQNEKAVNYGLRVTKLLNQILEVIRENSNSTEIEILTKHANNTAIECFINGSKDKQLSLYTKSISTLTEIISIAIKQEKFNTQYDELHKSKNKDNITVEDAKFCYINRPYENKPYHSKSHQPNYRTNEYRPYNNNRNQQYKTDHFFEHENNYRPNHYKSNFPRLPYQHNERTSNHLINEYTRERHPFHNDNNYNIVECYGCGEKGHIKKTADQLYARIAQK